MRFSNPHTRAGFTLIELLVVISIIGMLSSVVLVAIRGARAKSDVAAGFRFSNHVRSALYSDALFYLDFDTASVSGTSINGLVNLGSGTWSSTPTTGATPSSFVADTTLHRTGKYFQVGGADPFILGQSVSDQLKIAAMINGYNFTYSFWFNQNNAVCGNTSCPLVTNYSNGDHTAVIITPANVLTGRIEGVATLSYTLAPSANWVHIAYTAKSGTNVNTTLYINGKAVASGSVLASTIPTAIVSGVYVGGACCTYIVNSAMYDDVAMYNRTLLASEVEAIYAAGRPTHMLAQAK